MRNAFVAVAVRGGILSLAVVAACVGSDPAVSVPPEADGGGGGQPPVSTGDAGANDAAPGTTGSFCANVPPAANDKETVFCEDFSTDYAPRWETTSTNGTLSVVDVGGYKALDVTLTATTVDGYSGPRLLWRKIPEGGTAEVSFDFMLLEAPPKLTSGHGLLWFSRIGSLGNVSVGFGADLNTTATDFWPIISAGPGEEPDGDKLSFGPNAWVPVTLRYTTTPSGSTQFLHVGTNPEFTSSLSGDPPSDLALIANDGVYLGLFARFAPSSAHARFANVVIRTTKP